MTIDKNPLQQEISQNLKKLPKYVSRVFHGRGRFFPSLEEVNVEWYPPVLFVQCYQDQLGDDAVAALKAVFDEHSFIETVLLQVRPWPDVENEILFTRSNAEQQLPLEFEAPLSDGLMCQISLGKNRNTGVFPDMRSGWSWVQKHAEGKRVLNLFSYTSIFSLFALQGGARKVVNVDMCGSATKTAQYNHELNDLLGERVSIWKRDILKSNSQLAKQSKFDIIILDPPPFQKGSFRGWPDYQKLLRRCVNYLREGGVILVALNNQQVTFDEFERDIRDVIESIRSIAQIGLAEEIKELEPEKGLKLALIEL
ncbi:class I SAM-dependent methyltransferase [Pseudoteredinibacter isoporae]|uniref:23S rRNA (Cytosine1962-C5)-methyltransferase n=1 Tax=Pseudoteredinibacter isoporae TaxID=570281 RepID=A0A7X0JXW3_9GAMM|nr:class I SAM-dependent methyltransferase [Pseudoteredinibacter isoporae]MBB6523436.1 23S rRNA (cytosine1962-C5)-methyltransferase [Pseudoteredinibacter isoporae]NHO88947.1 methyltransferase [Pseudoteredinibacter isoporae]NIB24345.1 methyltransferase [Pseudoteredinibacter isoporae]